MPCGAGGGTRTPTAQGKRIFVPLQLSLPPLRQRSLWSGLSLRLSCLGLRRRPSSLYTSPYRIRVWLGIATNGGFPEFERFCIARFRTRTQSCLKSVASTYSATPAQHTHRSTSSLCQDTHSRVRPAAGAEPDTTPHALNRGHRHDRAHDHDEQCGASLHWDIAPVGNAADRARHTDTHEMRPPDRRSARCRMMLKLRTGTVRLRWHHASSLNWYPGRDSNSQGRSRRILSPLRLPIPPPGLPASDTRRHVPRQSHLPVTNALTSPSQDWLRECRDVEQPADRETRIRDLE